MTRIVDVAYVRYQAPDLALMRKFLLDFGLQELHSTERALFMRGYGVQPCVHITELGPTPKSLGFGLLAESRSDLEQLSARFGVPVKSNDEPGGGSIVTVSDPQGLRVDIVHGQQPAPPLPVRSPLVFNPALTRSRLGGVQRVSKGPSKVMRLGHVVLKAPDLAASVAFYQQNFGFKTSDGYYAEKPEQVIAAFMRCDLGAQYTDHHTLALISNPQGGFEHTAFEVLDWDDLQVGNQHLIGKGYQHSWGIGRHVEGSQIFDYWRDPFDNKVEHWTDGDLVNDDYVGGTLPLTPDALAQWGPPMGPDFMR